MKRPASFDVEAARDLLNGERCAVNEFVYWPDTPQGHTFWCAESVCLENGMALSDEARAHIEQWLENEDVG